MVEPFRWLLHALRELDTCRMIGPAGVGAIPATAIWDYADRYQCPLWFADVIEAADRELMAKREPVEAADGR